MRYHSNGDIQVVCGSYATPITADFIHTHSPFYAYKKYNKIWVQVGNNQSSPIYFQAETVAALMNYATKCYVTVTEDNDSEESDETEV